MKAPPVTKGQILKGLRGAHARFSQVHEEARAARKQVRELPANTPEWEAAAARAFAANERVTNELWRLVGAGEFYIGVRS